MPDGLLALFDYSHATKKGVTFSHTAAFNDVGDLLAVSDSRSSLIVFHLEENRFSCISREASSSLLFFNAKRFPE